MAKRKAGYVHVFGLHRAVGVDMGYIRCQSKDRSSVSSPLHCKKLRRRLQAHNSSVSAKLLHRGVKQLDSSRPAGGDHDVVCEKFFFFFFLPVYILQGWPDS